MSTQPGVGAPGPAQAGSEAGDADAPLVTALLAGDEAAFARCVDGWSGAMLRVARLHVSTDASAEEVVQEAWLAALRGLPGFEGRSRLRTWVFRIVVNLAKSRAERERRVVPLSSLLPEDQDPTVDPARFQGEGEPFPGGWRQFPDPWPSSPEGAYLAAETRGVLRAALERLPERQRTVMALRDVHGYGADEVCDLLDLSPGNQRVLLHRARAAVRHDLERYFAGERAG